MNYNQSDVRLVAQKMIDECFIHAIDIRAYACIYCEMSHNDVENIAHSIDCPVLVAKKLLEVK